MFDLQLSEIAGYLHHLYPETSLTIVVRSPTSALDCN